MTNLPVDGKVFPSSKNATENPTRHSEVFKFVFRNSFLPNCCNRTLQDKHSIVERGREVRGKSVQISIIYLNDLIKS